MRNCQLCKKEYKPRRPGQPGKFCSRSCKSASQVGKPRLGKTNKGLPAWNRGLKLPQLSGENHSAWKGENVSYRNLHRWVERLVGKPNKCTHCGKIGYGRQMHWANKSGNYQRNLTDWVRLCVKCHKAYDRNELVLP